MGPTVVFAGSFDLPAAHHISTDYETVHAGIDADDTLSQCLDRLCALV
ncbi:hypothetical protein H7I94_05275, partial [Mycobacterium szulgai]|nr:hypothetical protein [Mycobacterium szulgai]